MDLEHSSLLARVSSGPVCLPACLRLHSAAAAAASPTALVTACWATHHWQTPVEPACGAAFRGMNQGSLLGSMPTTDRQLGRQNGAWKCARVPLSRGAAWSAAAAEPNSLFFPAFFLFFLRVGAKLGVRRGSKKKKKKLGHADKEELTKVATYSTTGRSDLGNDIPARSALQSEGGRGCVVVEPPIFFLTAAPVGWVDEPDGGVSEIQQQARTGGSLDRQTLVFLVVVGLVPLAQAGKKPALHKRPFAAAGQHSILTASGRSVTYWWW
ncbi:uncharacterized protein J3D65DRAFT_626634 [Phyllosticta citribraziliensis]|uniref:Uncharacterized protein n=1 Tax=Phyllosticta citribraziliensis TaxID=989973 RepID=A0ABR1LMF4_9PEZI